jgi:hypothetical protein
VIIGVEFDREDGSILRNCDQRGLKPLDASVDPRTRLSGSVDQILMVKTKKR